MAITNLPALWSERYIDQYEEAMVYGNMVNREFEGVATYGGSVIIPDFRNVDIPIVDYDPDTGIGDPGYVNHETLTLTIDRYKAFQFYVDSIERVQQNLPKLDILTRKAAQSMARVVDSYIAGAYVNAENSIGDDVAPVALTADNIYSNLVAIAARMDANNVPEDERSVVLPVEAVSLLRTSEILARRDDVVAGAGGVITEIAGLTIRQSNRVPRSGDNFKILGAHPSGISMVTQLQEMRRFDPPGRFGDAIKGLEIFGMKVTRPEALVTLTATIA